MHIEWCISVRLLPHVWLCMNLCDRIMQKCIWALYIAFVYAHMFFFVNWFGPKLAWCTLCYENWLERMFWNCKQQLHWNQVLNVFWSVENFASSLGKNLWHHPLYAWLLSTLWSSAPQLNVHYSLFTTPALFLLAAVCFFVRLRIQLAMWILGSSRGVRTSERGKDLHYHCSSFVNDWKRRHNSRSTQRKGSRTGYSLRIKKETWSLLRINKETVIVLSFI